MSEDMSNPARRAARQRMREHDQRVRDKLRDTAGLTFQEQFERHAETVAPRSGSVDYLNRHFEHHGGLLTGHEPAAKKERDKLEATAKSFRYDERQEALLALKDRHDPKYDTIDTASKISLGYYERAKAVAKQLGLPTGKPKDDGHGW